MSKQSIYLGLMVLVSACLVDDERSKNLPKSLGSNHEIVVVVDSVVWKSSAGKALRNIFGETLITPQAERLFQLLKIQPDELNHVLKRHHSLIFMTTLDRKNKANRAVQEWFSSRKYNCDSKRQPICFPKTQLIRPRPSRGVFSR